LPKFEPVSFSTQGRSVKISAIATCLLCYGAIFFPTTRWPGIR